MKQAKQRLVLAGLTVLLGSALSGCTTGQTDTGEKGKAPAAVTVAVQAAKEGRLSDNQTFIGSVVAEETGSVIPRQTGTLTKLYVKKGDAVRKEQVIGEVDSTQQQLNVKDAETKLAEAKARLAQAKTVLAGTDEQTSTALARQSLEAARQSYERVQKLVEAGALPAAQLDDAKADWLRAQNAFRSAEVSDAKDQTGIAIAAAGVEQAQVALEKARQAVADTKIRAPLDGTIDSLSAVVGDTVSPQGTVAGIVNLNSIKVNLQVSELHLASFYKGAETQISISALRLETKGHVSFVGMAPANGDQLYPVEIRLENPDRRILPGMRANVGSTAVQGKLGIILPVEAIVEESGTAYVFIVRGDRAVKQKVDVIERNSSSVVIGKGLAPGDSVVVQGLSNLSDQAVVKVVK